MAFTTCKATLKYSLRRGQIPKQCTYKACNGSDFCGKHRNFIVNESSNDEPYPDYDLSYAATETCIVFPDVPDDTHCCICMDIVNNNSLFTLTLCKHYYHTECIDKWQKRSDDCPYCRASLTTGKKQTEQNRNNNRRNFILSEQPRRRQNTLYLPIPTQNRQNEINSIQNITHLRDTSIRGSYSHGYFTALYNSVVDNILYQRSLVALPV
jgi:hypothetical protein|uniref:RING-type domain-containing protein n=1 Tax=viral metagenome TaxID=1070528 RepID=A0A6C0BQ33_9ZZZZ